MDSNGGGFLASKKGRVVANAIISLAESVRRESTVQRSANTAKRA